MFNYTDDDILVSFEGRGETLNVPNKPEVINNKHQISVFYLLGHYVVVNLLYYFLSRLSLLHNLISIAKSIFGTTKSGVYVFEEYSILSVSREKAMSAPIRRFSKASCTCFSLLGFDLMAFLSLCSARLMILTIALDSGAVSLP